MPTPDRENRGSQVSAGALPSLPLKCRNATATCAHGTKPTVFLITEGRRLGCLERARQPHPSPRGYPEYVKAGDIVSFGIVPPQKTIRPWQGTGGRRAGREAPGQWAGRTGQWNAI